MSTLPFVGGPIATAQPIPGTISIVPFVITCSEPADVVQARQGYAMLLELAIESEVNTTGLQDPARIKTAIVLQRCDRESRIRQLEQSNDILRQREIPALKQLLRGKTDEHAAEVLEREAWTGRATRAEQKLGRAVAAVTVFAMIAVASLAYTVHAVIERTTR